MPAGRKVVSAIPSAPTKSSAKVWDENPSTDFSDTERTNLLKIEVLGRYFASTKIRTSAKTRDIDSWIIALETNSKSKNGSPPTSEKKREANTRIIPLIPAIPNPGITNISSKIRATPIMNIKISITEASCKM